MKKSQVSILVPNYKTQKLTQHCLELIRKHTDLSIHKVIVVDNDSNDESVNYLRSLDWITLVERRTDAQERPHISHARALDMAFEYVDTEFVLSIHTDTLVRHPKWLDFLMQPMQDSNIAGVGSWKLEYRPKFRRILKSIERTVQLTTYKLLGRRNHKIEGIEGNPYYLRSHCALFRTELVRSLGLGFSDNDENACKVMSAGLEAAGYHLKYLEWEALIKYLDHVDHATMLLNPEEFLKSGALKKRHLRRGLKRLNQSIESAEV